MLFRVEEELLEALDRAVAARGFKTRNEWFRSQVRQVLEEESDRKRLAQLLDRLTAEGVGEQDIVEMVKLWRAKKSGR